jgi:hypothetical protein
MGVCVLQLPVPMLMGVGKAVFVDKLPLNCVCVGGNGTVPLGVTCGRRSLASG